MRAVLSAGGLLVAMVAGIATLTPTAAVTVAKPAITGCGTIAIAKADLNNVAKLKSGAECFGQGEVIARNAKQARLDRVAVLTVPLPTGEAADRIAVDKLQAELVDINRVVQAQWHPERVNDTDAALAAEHAVSALRGPFKPQAGTWLPQPLADDLPAKMAKARTALDAYRKSVGS